MVLSGRRTDALRVMRETSKMRDFKKTKFGCCAAATPTEITPGHKTMDVKNIGYAE